MEEARTAGRATGGNGNWWDTPELPLQPAQEYFQRLFGLGQTYADFAQRFTGGEEPAVALERWLNDMQAWWTAFDRNPSSGGESRGNGTAAWSLPFDNWQRAAGALLPFAADALGSVKAEGLQHASTTLPQHLDRFLSIPAVGYARESQDQHQQYLRLVLRYGAAVQDYLSALAQVGLRSIERFREALAASDAPPITSLRALYDLWVDACEAAYAEYAKSAEHSERYGRLINALSAVKREASAITDEALSLANLPTRREIDTLHRYLHDARRANRVMRADIEALRAPASPKAGARRPVQSRRKSKRR